MYKKNLNNRDSKNKTYILLEQSIFGIIKFKNTVNYDDKIIQYDKNQLQYLIHVKKKKTYT